MFTEIYGAADVFEPNNSGSGLLSVLHAWLILLFAMVAVL